MRTIASHLKTHGVIHIQSVTIGSFYLTVEKKLLSAAYLAPGEGRGQGVRKLFKKLNLNLTD